MPRGSEADIDVLYVVALEEELRPARAVAGERFLGHPGIADWTPADVEDPTPYERGDFVLEDGARFSVALASLLRMGPDSASRTLATLIERLNPRCLAMSGVCAGRPGVAAFGDVIIAETAYFADEGKKLEAGLSPDIRTHSMPVGWLHRAKRLQPSDLPSYAAPTTDEAIDWFLVSLRQKRYPADQPELDVYHPEQSWKDTVDDLVARGLVRRRADHRATLTEAGSSRAAGYLEDHRRSPSTLPFSIHVGPMTSKPYVDASNPWEILTTNGVRTVFGLEMESGSVATSAWALKVPYWIVAKGVMDHATKDKTSGNKDRYKAFAARASAEVVWKFLVDRRLNDPTSVCHDGGVAAGQARDATDPTPPPRSNGALPASNLKHSDNVFVGRVVPRARCIKALRGRTKLVTVHGPSGSGKSRLAAEVAHDLRDDFDDHVYVVDLSVLADSALLLNRIVEVLQVKPDDPLIDALREVFRGTPALLVLENFERVADATGRLQDMLEVAPDLRIMVTSDAPLGLEGELLVAAESLDPKDAVDLFLARAQRPVTTAEELATVTKLCAELKEPLAIELAADQARTSALSDLQRVLRSPAFLDLENRVKGVPDRHRTLASAIAWSFDGLAPAEKDVFVRLCVLEGPWTQEAASAVVADVADGQPAVRWLSPLVERRFVLREVARGGDARSDETRYTMIFAMRAFGLKELRDDAAAHQRARAAQAAYFLALVESYADQFGGPDRLEACEELARDHGNVHAALTSFVEAVDVSSALRMAVVLDTYWWSRQYAEGYAHLKAVLDLGLPEGTTRSERLRRGRVCVAAGKLGLRQCDLDRAASFLDEARRIGSVEDDPELEALALERSAVVDIERTRYREARAKLVDALDVYGRVDSKEGVEGRADCLNDLGTVGCELDDEEVDRHFEEALDLYAEVAGPQSSAWVRIDQAQAAHLRGDAVMARVHAEYAQDVGRQHGESGLLTWAGHALGHVAAAEANLVAARELFAESLTLAALQGNLRPRLRAIEGFVVVASRAGKHEHALVLLAAVDQARKSKGLSRATTEHRLIEGAVQRSRTEMSTPDQIRCRDKGSLMSLVQATEFARSI